MTWEDKVEMVRLLNLGENGKATEYYLEHETWDPWEDLQALSMYANGVDVSDPAGCSAFKEKLAWIKKTHMDLYSYLDLRALMRLGVLQNYFDGAAGEAAETQ